MENKWIAFKDQLPERGSHVFVWHHENELVIVAGFQISVIYPGKYFLAFMGFPYAVDGDDVDQFTHWMPLDLPKVGPNGK